MELDVLTRTTEAPVAAVPAPGTGQHCKQDPHPSLVMVIPPRSMGWGL